jgi:hypothetical protein
MEELKADNSRLRESLMLLLDNVDYSNGMCGVHEMIGAILPKEILVKANEAKRISLLGCRRQKPTGTEQGHNKCSNRYITFNGETMTIGDWAARLGFSKNTLHERMKRGWSLERAFTQPKVTYGKMAQGVPAAIGTPTAPSLGWPAVCARSATVRRRTAAGSIPSATRPSSVRCRRARRSQSRLMQRN